MMFRLSRCLRRILCSGFFLAMAVTLQAAPDLRFDVAWFCCPCYPTNHLCEPQFDHLNIPSPNGHFMAMSTDEHRSTINSNGNVIAILYNNFDDGGWATNTGIQAAALIDQWVNVNFTNTGPKPDWLILNEISSGTWPSSQSYRTYVTDAVHALVNTYGYKVVIYAPFSNPGANGSDWQTLAGGRLHRGGKLFERAGDKKPGLLGQLVPKPVSKFHHELWKSGRHQIPPHARRTFRANHQR